MPEHSKTPGHTPTIDERADFCFGCGSENPQGLHLHFELSKPDGIITATAAFQLTRLHQGPPGYIHGGIIATMLDEAMSKINRPLNVLAMTRHMEVEYLRPVPIDTPLKLASRHLRRDGRKLFHAAEILSVNGRKLAEAKGFFLIVDPATMFPG
jgi:acyl-coenzyme A thioesterase PaaI-like protein